MSQYLVFEGGQPEIAHNGCLLQPGRAREFSDEHAEALLEGDDNRIREATSDEIAAAKEQERVEAQSEEARASEAKEKAAAQEAETKKAAATRKASKKGRGKK